MIVIVLCAMVFSAVAEQHVTPSDFYRKRQRLLEDESQSFLGSDLTLTLSEYFANVHLMGLKRAELNYYFKRNNTFPLARSFLDARKDIEASEVFKFISKMPKGGALHLHEYSMTSAEWIVSNLTYRSGVFMCQKPEQWLSYAWFSTEENNFEWNNCSWERISTARKSLGNRTIDDLILRSIQGL